MVVAGAGLGDGTRWPPLSEGPKAHADANPAALATVSARDLEGIRAAHTAWVHRVEPTSDGWQASNPGQQWVTRFDGQAFMTTPVEGGWTWGLRLARVGRASHPQDLMTPTAVTADGNRVQYQWDAGLTEWWVNEPRGLEHGFSLAERPAGDRTEPLDFTLAPEGGLRPQLDASRTGLEFVDGAGQSVVTYTHLAVWDADRRPVPSRFLVTHDARVVVRVDDADARYPLTVDPLAQQAYLKALPSGIGNAGHQFGDAVAIDGDTLVVGVPYEASGSTGIDSQANDAATGAGAAFVFVRSGSTWVQQAYLKPAAVGTGQAGDQFGMAVAISGDTIVVGAPNEDSSTRGIESTPDETLRDSGAAYVFVRTGSTWSQQAYLKPGANGTATTWELFGSAVAVRGDLVAVGAPGEASSTTGINSVPNASAAYAGAVYVYARSGSTWAYEAYLKPLQVGTTQAGDRFGATVALSGQTLVVGAPYEDSSTTGVDSVANELATDAGAAYVFVSTAGVWSQQAYLKPAAIGSTQVNEQFGGAVAIDGNLLVIGAERERGSGTSPGAVPDDYAPAGAAYVFRWTGANWVQEEYLKASNSSVGISFGRAVGVSGQRISVGAYQERSGSTGINSTPNGDASSAGAVYVFVHTGGGWVQEAYIKPHAISAGDWFGNRVAMSAGTLVVGAPSEDGSARVVNGAVDEEAPAAGAGYVFRLDADTWSQEAYLKPTGEGDGRREDQLGRVVAISGDTVAVSIHREDGSSTGTNGTLDERSDGAGAVLVFVRTGTSWVQQAYLKPALVGTTQVADGMGASLALDGDTLVVGAPTEDSTVAAMDGSPTGSPNELTGDSGAVYVFTRTGTVWSQQAFLKPFSIGTTERGDNFGFSVAVSGDTLVVGAHAEDSASTGVDSVATETASVAGAAYVFVRSGTTWTPQAYLKPAAVGTTQVSDYFGWSVAIDGDTLVVGAPFEDSSTTGINAGADELSSGSGAAYVFTRSGSTWSQEAVLKPGAVGATQQNDAFGTAVAISANTIVVGAPGEDGSATAVNGIADEEASNAGAAYVYTRQGGSWSQQAYLKAATVGTTPAGDALGTSVAIEGNDILLGAPAEDGSTTSIDGAADEGSAQAGAAYLFRRVGTDWTQIRYLKPGTVGVTGAGDGFGNSVDLSAGTFVVGAPYEDGTATVGNGPVTELGSNYGAAFIFADGGQEAPTVTTPTSASVTATGATLGGTVTADGGASVTARGVVYALTSANPDPFIGGTGVVQVPAGSAGTGVFTQTVTGLTPGSGYSFRAYATNSVGTSYSAAGTFSTPATTSTLSALALSAGTLTPAFAGTTTSYTASVPHATASITVTPTVTQAQATVDVQVGGGGYAPVASGAASGALGLAVGANTIDVRVTAQDGVTQQTYTLTVTRLAAAQTLTFAAVATQPVSAGTVLLSASATSGLAVTLTSQTPSVCTVTGATATLLAAGTCTVQATQAGDAQWEAAAAVTQSFAVVLPTVTLDRMTTTMTAQGGSQQFAVTVSPASVTWQAVSSAAWLTTTSAGTGSGAVQFVADANATAQARTATIAVGGEVHTVSQAAGMSLTLRVAEVRGRRARLEWTYEGPATEGFVVEGDAVPGGRSASVAAGAQTFLTVEVPEGRFYVRVRTVEDTERVGVSNEVPLVVGQPDVPSAPAQLAGMVNGDRVALTWTNTFTGGEPTDIDLLVGGAAELRLPLGLTDALVMNDVPPGTYTVEVVARNAAGSSAASNRVTLTFPGGCVAPQPPAWITYGVAGRLVTVTWQAPSTGGAATEYWVTAEGLGTLETRGARAAQASLRPGTYRVWVQAVNPCGISAPSVVQTIVVP